MTRLGSLLGEIHRRSVWQILGSYAVGAWVILQLAETLAGLIGLPLWFGPTLVGLVVAGFPLILLTSFLQGGRSKEDKAARAASEENTVKGTLRRLFTWKNAFISVVGVGVLLGAGTVGWSGLRAAGIGSVGSLQAKGILDTDERLILADFADRTQEGTLGETVTALFRIDLAQSTSVRLMEPSQLTPALVRMERDPSSPFTQAVALELAEREGIKGVVTGEVLPLGSGAVISARLVTPSGETLVAMDETAKDVSTVPEAVDALSAQLRVRIGESMRTIQGDPPLNEVTTSSLMALRKYAQADQANDRGDWERAVTLLEEAIAEDSTFAMAWRKVGVLFQNENRDPERARSALTRAYELRDRLTERERYLAEAVFFTYVEDDQLRVRQAYETVLEDYPTDRIALNNLAVTYSGMGDRERAAEIYLRAIKAGTAPAISYPNAAQTFFDLGKPDTAQFVMDLFSEAYPENPDFYRISGALASARFDFDQAEAQTQRLLDVMAGNPGWEMAATANMASVSLIRGRIREGMDYIMETFDKQEMIGAQFIPQPRPVFEGLVEALIQGSLFDDDEAVVRALDQGWANRPRDVEPGRLGHLQIATIYASSGRPDRARELIAEYENDVDAEARSEDGNQSSLHLARASIATAEDRIDDALAETELAREVMSECALCVLTELGTAQASAGKHEEAVVTFQQYLDTPFLHRLGTDNFNLHPVLKGLAESQEALGNLDEAARYYQWMLELWSNADPELQPQITGFREALARVSGS